MYNYPLAHGIGPGERNDKDDLAGFGRGLERATGLDPWLPHAWPMAAFPEARTSDGYMPGFGGALRGFQIDAGLGIELAIAFDVAEFVAKQRAGLIETDMGVAVPDTVIAELDVCGVAAGLFGKCRLELALEIQSRNMGRVAAKIGQAGGRGRSGILGGE